MVARVRLRQVTLDHLSTITRMAVAFNKEDGHPLSRGGRRALKALCTGTPHGGGYMIEHAGRDVGYLVMGLGFSVEFGGVDAFLDEFYVEPAFRGRGVGTAALIALGGVARKLNVKALHLEAMPANDRAARLYERLGFKLSERRLMSKRY